MFRAISALRTLRYSPHVLKVPLFSTKPYSLEFNHSYDETQTGKILDIVNTRTVDELLKFNISKQRVAKIFTRKLKQGDFRTLEDMLELDGFGIKVLEKFCDSILESSKQKASKKENSSEEGEDDLTNPNAKNKQQFVVPVVLEASRKKITSCVSFQIDLNYIAWTKLSLDSESDGNLPIIRVEDWMSHSIGNDDKKLSLSELIQNIIYVNNFISEADVYVVEAQMTSAQVKQPGTPVQVNINIQKSQVIAMLSMLMAARGSANPQPKQERNFSDSKQLQQPKPQQTVFFLKTYLASRLFKTYIGKERVSTQGTIEDILRYNYTKDQPEHPLFSSIDIPMVFQEQLNSASKCDREYMGQSMLIGLTFLKLCILKCPQSLAYLNIRNN